MCQYGLSAVSLGDEMDQKLQLEEQLRAVMDKYKYKRRQIRELNDDLQVGTCAWSWCVVGDTSELRTIGLIAVTLMTETMTNKHTVYVSSMAQLDIIWST